MQTLAFWQTLSVAVIGAGLTFLGVLWNSRSNLKQLNLKFEHEKQLQRQLIFRERLEELYGLIGQWDKNMYLEILHTGMLAEGLLSHEEYLERYPPTTEFETATDYTRLEMLVGIYGKSFKSAYESANNARDLLVALNTRHEKTYLDGEPTGETFKDVMQAHNEFQETVKLLKAKIAEAV